jgi:hypothetical protein
MSLIYQRLGSTGSLTAQQSMELGTLHFLFYVEAVLSLIETEFGLNSHGVSVFLVMIFLDITPPIGNLVSSSRDNHVGNVAGSKRNCVSESIARSRMFLDHSKMNWITFYFYFF